MRVTVDEQGRATAVAGIPSTRSPSASSAARSDESTLAGAIERGRGLSFEQAIDRASRVISG